jgi:hypothetical protein
MMPQLFATFITDRFARGDEDFQVHVTGFPTIPSQRMSGGFR